MNDTALDLLPAATSSDRRCRGWTLDNRVRRWFAPARNEVDLLTIRPGQHVADLGAGVGYLTASLLERIGPLGILDAVDPEMRGLEAIRTRFGNDPRLRILRASAAHVPVITDQSVDRVVLSLVLCCMVDKGSALDESWRILRPGGLALVSYPERRWRLSRRKASLRVWPEYWERLVAGHPWKVLDSSRERWIRRQIIQRPDVESDAGVSAPSSPAAEHSTH